MGVLAVVGDRGDIQVERLHLNLWCLPGLGLRRYVFFLDIGLSFVTGADPLQSFKLVLPVLTDDNSGIDLTDRLRNPSVAELIFGRPVELTGNRFDLDWGKGKHRLSPVSLARDSQAGLGGSGSQWTIKPVTQPRAGTSSYSRMRFTVANVARLWRWDRNKVGSLVDLRIGEFREIAGLQIASSIEASYIAPTKQTAVFVVAPGDFRPRSTSPSPAYVRALEGEEWSPYLGRRTHRRHGRKMLIYQWRSDQEVTPDRPLRAFLELERIRPNAIGYLRIGLVVLLGLLIANTLTVPTDQISSTAVGKGWEAVTDSAIRVWGALSALGLWAVWSRLSRWVGKALRARKQWPSIRETFRKIELWWFKP